MREWIMVTIIGPFPTKNHTALKLFGFQGSVFGVALGFRL